MKALEHIHIYICMFIYLYTHTYLYVYVYSYMYFCTYIHIYVYLDMYAFICISGYALILQFWHPLNFASFFFVAINLLASLFIQVLVVNLYLLLFAQCKFEQGLLGRVVDVKQRCRGIILEYADVGTQELTQPNFKISTNSKYSTETANNSCVLYYSISQLNFLASGKNPRGPQLLVHTCVSGCAGVEVLCVRLLMLVLQIIFPVASQSACIYIYIMTKHLP